jgi:CRISPR/Cas system-associated exonuclease Cas4 (RecB family)
MKTEIYVSASEIGEYVYCKSSWWLRFKGIVKGSTPEMLAGSEAHDKLYRDLQSTGKFKKLAIGLVICGIILIVIFSLLYFLLT